MHPSPACAPFRMKPLLVVLLLAGAPAQAAEIAASVGGTVTGSSHWSGTVYLDASGRSYHTLGIDWRPVASLGWIGEHHVTPGESYPDLLVAAAGIRLADAGERRFLSFQVGVASHRSPAISSHVQFVSTLGWRRGRLLLMLRHISNGRLMSGPNHGETMLLAGTSL